MPNRNCKAIRNFQCEENPEMNNDQAIPYGVFTPEQDNKTTTRQMLNLCIPMMPFTPGPSYIARSGVKGIIGMHSSNICLVVVLSLSCSGVKTPLEGVLFSFYYFKTFERILPPACKSNRAHSKLLFVTAV